MFDFTPDADLTKPERYRQLATAAASLVEGETDAVANMANIAALMAEYLPDLNWAGFYRVAGEELVLGPFIGRPACLRITLGEGVCGVAASDRRNAAGRGCRDVSRTHRLRCADTVRTGGAGTQRRACHRRHRSR